MTRVVLVGGSGGGGEEVFVRGLAATPPPGVRYTPALEHHESVAGARALTLREMAFNRAVHPMLWPLPGLRAYDVSRDVDLVHVHNFASWLRVPPGCPVVVSVGGSSYPHYMERYLGWPRERVRARYRRARRVYRALGIRSEVATPEAVDAIVVFSDFAARRLADFAVPGHKVYVIPPGFDIPRPPGERAGVGDGDDFTFLLVGRDPHRKGADLAVAAVEELRREDVPVRLVLVGDTTYPEWSRDGVEGHAAAPRDRLFGDFYARADAVLVPSRAEGYGFAAVEALGMGLPVIAARNDALPEIVGDAGLLVDTTVGELAGAMARLASDPVGARALGARGRARFESMFTLEKARASLGALYTRLLAG